MNYNESDYPVFHAHASDEDIPPGYGIDESHDGGFYVYRVNGDYLKDHQGLDISFTEYESALGYLCAVAKDERA